MRSKGKALLLVLIVLLLLGFAGVVVGLLLMNRDDGGGGRRGTVLRLDLSRGVPTHLAMDSFSRSFFDPGLDLREVVAGLEQGAADPSVVGLVARVGAAPMGLATVQELRDALVAFSAAGKKTFAYADTLGEFGPGNGAYYLASAFDEILLQPSGDVGLTGLLYQTSFLRGTLDKIGIEPRMDHRWEYKNAMNSLTETSYTPSHEEAMRELLESQFSQMVEGIATGRGLEPEAVRELVDRGPYYGAEAVNAGLVDHLAYRDQVYDRLEEEFGDDVGYESLTSYRRRGNLYSRGERIALIYGIGAVVRGQSDYDPLSGNVVMGSDTLAKAFRDAVDDPRVRAILFRVDSPGGSYVASDTIWHETVRAREAGKPVIVSMGDVAGSGGYFVAMAADSIVAQPGTITGSIGVYAGKLLNRELWNKIGISWDQVGSSENADMWSTIDDFSEAGWERFQASLDRIYDDFVGKVAAGRDLPVERVGEIARGRIWTGETAKELGLVDELGGFPTALAEVRRVLELEEDAELRLELFPEPRSAFELLLDQMPMVEGAARSRLPARLLTLVRTLRAAGLLDSNSGPLTTPLPVIDGG